MYKCEICNNECAHVDKHHIQSKTCGGSDNAWNIIKICQNCHALIHRPTPKGKVAKKHQRIIVEGKFESTSPNGYSVVWRRESEKSITGFTDPDVYLTDGTMSSSSIYQNFF